MVELAKGKLEILGGEGLSSIFFHELDGDLDEISGLELDESLEKGLLCFLEVLLHSLALHDMMYEI